MSDYHDRLNDYLTRRSEILLITLDTDAVVIDANARMTQLAGRDIVGCLAREVFVDFPGNMTPEWFTAAADAPRTLTISCADNFPRSFRFTVMPFDSGFILVGENDNERTADIQKEMVKLNSEMANMSRDTMRKNAELQRAVNSRNQLLGMAAHDLRSPLTAISLYADIMLMEMESSIEEKHEKFLTMIKQTTEFMSSLINDVLDLSAIESGQVSLTRAMVDIRRLVSEEAELAAAAAEHKGITVSVAEPDEGEYMAECDERKIRQVMDNLLTNAVKFSNPDSAVTVRLFRGSQTVEVAVEDTGIGMSPEDAAQIFKPFAKLEAKGTAGERSTGLGLAIAKRIITAHGGFIRVHSERDAGTTMTFTLPAASAGIHDDKGESR